MPTVRRRSVKEMFAGFGPMYTKVSSAATESTQQEPTASRSTMEPNWSKLKAKINRAAHVARLPEPVYDFMAEEQDLAIINYNLGIRWSDGKYGLWLEWGDETGALNEELLQDYFPNQINWLVTRVITFSLEEIVRTALETEDYAEEINDAARR